MRTHPRRRATDRQDRPGLKRRIVFILTLIAGIIVAGVMGIQEADAVALQTAGAAAVNASQVVALVLLVILFFLTAGLVGLFWLHLADGQQGGKR
ncbi:MAG: hypothetical protein AAF441_25415 [Pseudomonadota bacterium]